MSLESRRWPLPTFFFFFAILHAALLCPFISKDGVADGEGDATAEGAAESAAAAADAAAAGDTLSILEGEEIGGVVFSTVAARRPELKRELGILRQALLLEEQSGGEDGSDELKVRMTCMTCMGMGMGMGTRFTAVQNNASKVK